jgi:hypothetical protein
MSIKGDLAIDPRGLFYEAYQIEGIGLQDCRMIFLDWAMATPAGADMPTLLQLVLQHYGKVAPDHPMTAILNEGLSREARPVRRR